jgi:hypothetical protein
VTDHKAVEARLRTLLDAEQVTSGMTISQRRGAFILGREEPPGPHSDGEPDDRVKLTPLGAGRFGVSVKRHTGRWEKTPFVGALDEVIAAIASTMQHLVAPW